jgi:hypothetical protein
MKFCPTCKEHKPKTEFQKNLTRRDGLVNRCKKCSAEKNKKYLEDHPEKAEKRKAYYSEWAKENKEKKAAACKKYGIKNRDKLRSYFWEWTLKKEYNLTPEKFYEMLDAQENRCCICGRDFNGEIKKPAVDHDHRTGVVRGLLCDLCNRGLGFFFDNTDYLSNAIDYLNFHSGNGGKNV